MRLKCWVVEKICMESFTPQININKKQNNNKTIQGIP